MSKVPLIVLLCTLAACDGPPDTDTDTDTDTNTDHVFDPCIDRGPDPNFQDLSECDRDATPFIAYAQTQSCSGGIEWSFSQSVVGLPDPADFALIGVDPDTGRTEVHRVLEVTVYNRVDDAMADIYTSLDVLPDQAVVDGSSTQIPCNDTARWAIALYDNDALLECFVLHKDGWGDVSALAPDYVSCKTWAWFED